MTDTIVEELSKFPPELRKTVTVDNGMEFSNWKTLEEKLGVTVYYCDPH